MALHGEGKLGRRNRHDGERFFSFGETRQTHLMKMRRRKNPNISRSEDLLFTSEAWKHLQEAARH